jgi:hypothetical protein
MEESIGIGVLVYKNVNMGDWYQSASAMYVWWKYLKSSQTFSEFIQTCIETNQMGKYPLYWIERDHISSFKKPDTCSKIVILCNGWWMVPINSGYNFPPPSYIVPIFTSFHIANSNFLNEKILNYLKQNGPIGCRDLSTMSLLLKHTVNCYFSGCITMLLHLKNPKLGFTVNIDYSNTHIYNDAPVIDKTYTYAVVTQQGVFDANPKWIYKSIQYMFDYSKAQKITTKRLHVWFPLMYNGCNVELWNEAKKRIYELNDVDPFSPQADRFKGLFGLQLEERQRNLLMNDTVLKVNDSIDIALNLKQVGGFY